jgi:hypothetical protein
MQSNEALAGNTIKKILKKAFPDIKFSVRSEGYSGGDNVNVYYTDGVPREEIEKLINHFQEGHFDGMIDMYEYSNVKKDIPQTKYLFVSREMSEATKEKIKQQLIKDWGFVEFSDDEVLKKCNCWPQDLIWREFVKATVKKDGTIIYEKDKEQVSGISGGVQENSQKDCPIGRAVRPDPNENFKSEVIAWR